MYYFDSREFKSEEDLDLYLIIKYWNKHYDVKVKANDPVMVKNIYENKKNIAKELGRIDIGFFAFYYLNVNFIPNDENSLRELDKVHYDIFEELNSMFVDDSTDKEEFILPRGLGKSTVINKLLGAWCHCYKISRYTVVIGKKEDDAISFIDGTKEFLKLEKITETFGVLVLRSDERVVNKQEIELTNNTKIYAVGSGTSIRGTTYACNDGVFRPSLIIVDDFISEADILTDDGKDKVVKKYYNEILESGDKAVYRKNKKVKAATKFLVVGTPLAADDFINTIRNDAEFKNFHRSVVEFNPDKYFIENTYWQNYKKILFNTKDENRIKNAEQYFIDNIEKMTFKTLWNDKFKPCQLANTYYTKRLSFMQELMCDCQNVGELWIKTMAKMDLKEILDREFEKTVLSIDQATTNNSKSDSTAFTILSKSNGFYFVKKGLLEKFDSVTEFDKYIARVIELLKSYEEITHIILEKNVYKGIDATRIEEEIEKDDSLSRRNIKVLTIFNTKNKDARIMTISDKINSGQVIFNEEDKVYNKEVKDFRGQNYSLHDDAIDSLEIAINNIDNIKVVRNITLLDRKLLGV